MTIFIFGNPAKRYESDFRFNPFEESVPILSPQPVKEGDFLAEVISFSLRFEAHAPRRGEGPVDRRTKQARP